MPSLNKAFVSLTEFTSNLVTYIFPADLEYLKTCAIIEQKWRNWIAGNENAIISQCRVFEFGAVVQATPTLSDLASPCQHKTSRSSNAVPIGINISIAIAIAIIIITIITIIIIILISIAASASASSSSSSSSSLSSSSSSSSSSSWSWSWSWWHKMTWGMYTRIWMVEYRTRSNSFNFHDRQAHRGAPKFPLPAKAQSASKQNHLLRRTGFLDADGALGLAEFLTHPQIHLRFWQKWAIEVEISKCFTVD